jgi:hypothetical protein
MRLTTDGAPAGPRCHRKRPRSWLTCAGPAARNTNPGESLSILPTFALSASRRCRARLSRPRAALDPPVRRLRADSFPSNRQAPCSALGPFSEHSVWIGAGHIGRHYGLRITLPRIRRLSRSSCALRAAASGIRSKIAGRMPELANRLTVSLTRRRILSGSSS